MSLSAPLAELAPVRYLMKFHAAAHDRLFVLSNLEISGKQELSVSLCRPNTSAIHTQSKRFTGDCFSIQDRFVRIPTKGENGRNKSRPYIYSLEIDAPQLATFSMILLSVSSIRNSDQRGAFLVAELTNSIRTIHEAHPTWQGNIICILDCPIACGVLWAFIHRYSVWEISVLFAESFAAACQVIFPAF
jgi:hypothetical protein